jgi:hypothetical protein
VWNREGNKTRQRRRGRETKEERKGEIIKGRWKERKIGKNMQGGQRRAKEEN